MTNDEGRATGGTVPAGSPRWIGTANCPPWTPDTSKIKRKFSKALSTPIDMETDAKTGAIVGTYHTTDVELVRALHEAMSEPISDEDLPTNQTVFLIRKPTEIELEQLRSEVSREVKPNSGIIYIPTAHDETLEERINAELDRKQAARDNIND